MTTGEELVSMDIFEALLLAGEVATTDGWLVAAVAPGSWLGRADLTHLVVMAYHWPFPQKPFYLASVDHWRKIKGIMNHPMSDGEERGR